MLQLSTPKVGGWTQNNLHQPLLELRSMKHGSSKKGRHKFLHSASNFWHWKLEAKSKKLALGMCWSFQAPRLEAHKGVETMFLTSTCLWAFNLELKNSTWGQSKLFYVRPPTFDVESWRLSVRKLCSIGLGASEPQVHRLCKGAKAKCFYIWHILSFQTLSLETLTWAECKYFCARPPTFGVESRRLNTLCAWPPTFSVESWGLSTFFCPRAFMHPLSNMFESSMRAQGIFCCLAFHRTPKLCAWGLHERSITRFPYLTSNF
jgi:hypothetical protein